METKITEGTAKKLRNLKPFKSGAEWNGNAKGRPKGTSIKERVKSWLETHPDDMELFVKHFVKKNRDLAWQMLEGRPAQATDVTSGGEKIEFNVKLTDGNNTPPETVSPNEGQPQI